MKRVTKGNGIKELWPLETEIKGSENRKKLGQNWKRYGMPQTNDMKTNKTKQIIT